MAVWHGSRGLSGKSYLLATLGHIESLFLGVDIAILGGSGQQSKNVHNYQEKFWNYPTAPKYLLRRAPLEESTEFKDGQTVMVLLASQTSVRAPHPVRLRLDEVDEMKLEIYDAAMGQTMSMNPEEVPAQTVSASTWQNANGTFTEVLRRAADKGHPINRWCYRETVQPIGWLPASEVLRKKLDVSESMWNIEYELGEPTIGNRALNAEKVDEMFDVELGDYEGMPGEYIEVAEPLQEGVYVTGADWAKKRDYTVVCTMRVDTNPAQVVAFERINRAPWSYMIGRFLFQLLRYNSYGNHDATGLGDVVADDIREQLSQLPHGRNRYNIQGEIDRLKDTVMVGQERSTLLSDYVVSVERGEIRSPRIHVPWNQHRYCSTDDLYGSASRDHLPDTMSAMALAWQVRYTALASRTTPIALGIGGTSRWQ